MRVLGQLAEMVPGIGRAVSGVLVRRDFETSLLAANDLPNYTDLSSSALALRTALPFSFALWPQLIAALLAVWADVEVIPAVKTEPEEEEKREESDSAKTRLLQMPSLLVCGRVTVRPSIAVPLPGDTSGASGAASGASGTAASGAAGAADEADPRKRRKKTAATAGGDKSAAIAPPGDCECIILEWGGGTCDDLIADSVAAVACQCCVGPWAVLQQPRHSHDHPHSHVSEKDWRKELGEAGKSGHKLRPEAATMIERALAGHFGENAVSSQREEKSGAFVVTVGGDAMVVLAEETGKWEVVAGASEARAAQARAVVERLFARGIVTPIKANIL